MRAAERLLRAGIFDISALSATLLPACCRILPPLRNRSGLEEVVRFNGMFKGFTFRVRRQKFQLPLLRYLLALPHIKHIEPDQLFYPEAATGAWSVQQHPQQDMQHLYTLNNPSVSMNQC